MTGTVKTLWFVLLVGLVGLGVLGLMFPYKGHFGLDELPLFGAWFGIAVGIGILIVAKVIGALLKREDSYYG
jgi:hypothetical protein